MKQLIYLDLISNGDEKGMWMSRGERNPSFFGIDMKLRGVLTEVEAEGMGVIGSPYHIVFHRVGSQSIIIQCIWAVPVFVYTPYRWFFSYFHQYFVAFNAVSSINIL